MSLISANAQNEFSRTVPGIFYKTAKTFPDRIAFRDIQRVSGVDEKAPYQEKFQEISTSWKEYKKTACNFAKALIAVGLKPNNAVTIQGNNSSKWIFANMGTWIAGGISTGVYPTNNPELSQHAVKNSGANVVVIEDEKQLEKYAGLKNRSVKCFVVWSKFRCELQKNLCAPVYTWDEFLEKGKTVSKRDLKDRLEKLRPNNVCSLLYTSGTTDLPKAAALTHRNFISAVEGTAKKFNLNSDHIGISYLPLSHIAAQMLDIVAPIFFGYTVNIAPPDALKGTNLKQHILHTKPTYFLAVPRVWEKFMEAMKESTKTLTGVKKILKNVRQLFADDLKKISSKQNRKQPNYIHQVRGTIDRFIVDRMNQRVLKAIGLQNCKIAASGAGALDPKIINFFKNYGIVIADIYGLSETTGPVTISRNITSISSGYPLAGTKLVIADQDKEGKGEIRIKGPNVFKEYWNNVKATKDAFDKEGFFCTGDEGKLDKKGNLHITGRIKELIKTSGGENIPPVRIEQKIKEALPMIDHAVVIGNKRNYLTCLLTLQTEPDSEGNPTNKLAPIVLKELSKLGSPAKTLEEAQYDKALHKFLMEGIKQANLLADSQAQCVQKITLVPKNLSIANGLITPTQKLKRSVIEKHFEDYIEKMYQDKP